MTSEEINMLADAICQKISLQPRWLKPIAASKYSSLGIARLKTLVASGKIIGFKDPESLRGDWIFDKVSIDEYMLQNAAQTDFKDEALAILASL